MAIVLHRFSLSHYSEKGRALLEFKRLPFRIEEHRLGPPQLRLFRLSGQRKVPVIEDGARVVADSTRIALYLEERYPERRLLPAEARARAEVLALEERIDAVLGDFAPVLWFDHAVRERPEELARFLELEVWGAGDGRVLGRVARALWRAPRFRRLVRRSEEETRAFLRELCDRLGRSRYLVGDEPTLADVAAVGLTFHLEYPRSRHLARSELAGIGVPGVADAPELRRFFEWRRAFYAEQLG